MHVTRFLVITLATATVATGASVVALGAQRGAPQAGNVSPAAPGNMSPGGPGGPPGGGAPARAALPAATSSVANRPDTYYGQYVSIYGVIEQSLSPTAFSMDQDRTKSSDKVVLVLAPRLHKPVEPNTYVTVIGEVVHADAAEIAKKAKPDAPGLPPDVLAKYAGRPVVLATSVVTPALDDLARFIPPALTPEEAVLDKAMKAVGQANGALRKGVEGANAEIVKAQTAILQKAFAETETFWKGRGNAEAVKMAQTARQATLAIETAAGMGNWNEAKAQNTTLGQQCQSCHVYRERLEDGSFAIKKQ
jgi:hypothetical protein